MHRLFTLFVFLMAGATCIAQYQLLNPGFESWEGTSATSRPTHWSSFPQADGSWAWAASTAQHYHRYGGRPGSTGGSYVTIYSRSVLGIIANGNMTTGQVHAGSTSASSSSNYNYTHRGSDYCHPFTGTPDSMYVWVSYYAATATSEGCVRAYLHGNSDFRDPNDASSPSNYRGRALAQFSRTTTSASSPTWVQQRVPFTYDGTSSVNYILMSMTTNVNAGGGSTNDSLSVDDIEFVYSAWLDNITLNGDTLDGFQRDVFDYTVALSSLSDLHSATLAFTPQANDATTTIDTLAVDATTLRYVLNVLAEDTVTARTYTVTLTCPPPPCDTVEDIAVDVQGASALVTWSSGGTGQQWEVEYGRRGFARGQGMTNVCDFPSILLTGLDYDSEYELYVRAYCGDLYYSDWSSAITFETGEEPDTVCLGIDSLVIAETGLSHCVIVIHSPYLDSGDSVDFQVVLMCDADTVADTIVRQTDGAAVSFSNLREGTAYVVYARTLCDSAHQSGWARAVFVTDADTTAILEACAAASPFILYPNPATGQVCCKLPGMSVGRQGGWSEEAELTLYDAMGRVVMRRHLTSDSLEIDLSGLPAGIYTVGLQTGAAKSSQRLSVLR